MVGFRTLSTLMILGVFCWSLSCSSPETRCSKTSECPEGWSCVDLICKKPKPVTCTLDSEKLDCDDGTRCVDGSCVPLGKRCAADTDCLNGQICGKQSVCVALTDGGQPPETTPEAPASDRRLPQDQKSCTQDTDCPTGLRCVVSKGTCEKPTIGCKMDDECAPGEHCKAQTCTGTRRTCGTNPNGCETGYRCGTDSFCYRELCRDNRDCSVGQICDITNNQCKENTQDCTVTGCPNGQECSLQNKRCEPKKTTSCTSDNDCPAPAGTCRNGKCESCASQFTCTTGKCDIPSGRCVTPPCSTDFDCAAPKGSCQNGQCLSCTSDFSCQAGQSCENATGRCLASSSLCSADSDCPPPNGSCRNQQCTTCFQKFSCPSGQACIAATGRCETRTSGCTSDTQCLAPNGTCLSGACRSCATHFTCKTGERCDASTGRCKANTGACQQHTDCTSSQHCKAGQCTTKQCDPSGSPSCPAGQTCQNFECTGTTTSSGCLKNTDCKGNEFCQEGRCIQRRCDALTPCPGGMRCEQNACTPIVRVCLSGLCGGQQRCLQDENSKNHCLEQCTTPGNPCAGGGTCVQFEPAYANIGNYCLPPSTLTTGQTCQPKSLTGHCPAGHACLPTTSSTTFRCYKLCTPGSSGACKSSEECLELSPGKGVCTSTGVKGAGDYCYRPASVCRNDSVCVYSRIYSSSGRCHKRCPAPGSQSTCKSTEECVPLPKTNLYGACVPKARLSKGRTCYGTPLSLCDVGLSCELPPLETSGTCHKLCKTKADCTTSEECADRLCLPTGTASEDRSCTPGSSFGSSRCKAGLVCKKRSSSSFSGTCRMPCQSDTDCSAKAGCFNGFCINYTTYTENRSCTETCKKGLICASTTSFSSYCYQPCQKNADCTNTSYPECAGGFCLKKSTLLEGASCYDSLTSRCESPFVCTYPPTSSTFRRCLRACSSNTDCTNTAYPKCLTKTGIGSFCYR